MASEEPKLSAPLVELGVIYLRLGLTAFGGPAAHIAMMHREFVENRQWLSEAEFLDLLGAVNLIPGPNSTQMAMFIGKERAGGKGLLMAGLCFILPAALLVSACAWAYARYGANPNAQHLLYGVKPVIVAIIAQAIWVLSRKTVTNLFIGLVGATAVALSLLNIAPLAIVVGCGACTSLVRWFQDKRQESFRPLLGLALLIGSFVLAGMLLSHQGSGHIPFGIGPLFFFFLKVGAVLYGSGYTLLAYLNHDLVARWAWLTKGQLLDAVAVGQFTPGPVFTTATFIGFFLGGPLGALAATVGIFLPSFVFIALSSSFLPKLGNSGVTRGFMDGVNIASLALMAVVALTLAQTAINDWLSVLLAICSLLVLLRFRLNSAWLIGVGAIVGLCGSFWSRSS